MPDWENYATGLKPVSRHVHAYLQPDGGWGLNNAGVVISRGQSLVIDALMDIPRTERMLAAIREADESARSIDMLLLTHWHIDHTASACVFKKMGSKIIASRICADYMSTNTQTRWLKTTEGLTGDARKAMDENFGGKFNLAGIEDATPTDVFEGNRHSFKVGDLDIEVHETKPSHTRSDSIVHIPAERVVHTGDLITAGRHLGLQFPFLTHLIDAMELLVKLDAKVYIAGHGPMLFKQDINDRIDYLHHLQSWARKGFDRGLDFEAAAEDFLKNLGPYKNYANPALAYDTMRMIFCELRGDTEDFARKNNAAFVTQGMLRKKMLPKKMPELFLRF